MNKLIKIYMHARIPGSFDPIAITTEKAYEELLPHYPKAAIDVAINIARGDKPFTLVTPAMAFTFLPDDQAEEVAANPAGTVQTLPPQEQPNRRPDVASKVSS